MYEFHGWATIRERYKNFEDEEDKTDFIIKHLVEYIKQLDILNWAYDIKVFNGDCHLMVSGFTNHASPASEQVFDLYKYVAHIAPGSYGILYVYDDEDKRGFNNDFRVHILSKGNIVEKADPFLSPFFPRVEETN